ncbi:AAA family ATPase [Succinivibrio sp.]|uniref:AAA family ATPase n=1 Tax=Succinivibrio sp. TaxID=2053619 RepID=UPI0025DA99C1|nr:AAA family ATPase [Succinivibrio sp.]MBQ9219875.1 AAA family ATPase [Succinivibrio sp.]
MKKDVLLYTGGEDFAEIINGGGYFVDKTAYMKELLITDAIKNSLFIRPRRFGKTLNLDMIRQFCRINYQNPGDKSYQQKLFVDNGRKLAVAGEYYKEFREKIMGEFPVISISFKTVEGTCFQQAVSQLIYKVGLLYDEFLFLIESSKQDLDDIEKYKKNKSFCKDKQDELDNPQNLNRAISILGTAIPQIASMLYKEYGRKVIVIIDEYDVPLQKAMIAEEPYYNKMLNIIRTLSGNIFKKDNEPWLYKGIVSGCLRIAHQSVFTDANNFTTFGMNDEPYTGFFGFTKEETHKLLNDCGLSDKESEVKEWYDGYRFGNKHIYCPWSLISYCYAATQKDIYAPQPFWVNTSGNDLITIFTDSSMESHNAENIDKLQKLMEGENVDISLMEFTTYPDLRVGVSFDVFMTLMLHTGYVTFAEGSGTVDKVTVRIPNQEILYCFNKKRELLFGENNPYWYNQALKLVDLLMANKTDEAQALISSMLKEFLSIRNTGDELYYHGFMVGVIGIASAAKGISFHEEIESGDGFPDIVLKNDATDTVAVIEFKKGRNERLERIQCAEDAAKQILDKRYAEPYLAEKYKNVFAIGIGFGGKDCYIQTLGNLAKSSI